MAPEDMVDEMKGNQVLSRRQVANILGISLPTLWRLRTRKEFPPPIKISAGRVGWCARVVCQWLAERNIGSNGED